MSSRSMSSAEGSPQPKRAKLEDPKERVKKPAQEQEQALLSTIEEIRSEVLQFEIEARAIQAKLAEARKKLADAEAQLARVQNRSQPKPSLGSVKVKAEPEIDSPSRDENGSTNVPTSKPPLFIPSSRTTSLQTSKGGANIKSVSDSLKPSKPLSAGAIRSGSDLSDTSVRQLTTGKMTAIKSEPGSSPEKMGEKKISGLEHKEQVDLVDDVRSSRAPSFITMLPGYYIPSQHKRKLRSLVINPARSQICVTSALDGVVNFWQIQGKGIGMSMLSTMDCLSPGQRRWPEDMVWHPSGDCLFACYSADAKDHQVAILNSSSKKVNFLEEKPHYKGIINSIVFMPWHEEPIFATGGSDHAVVMWSESEEGMGWKAKALHRSLHTSAVMGVAGLQHRQLVLSVGADKRIVGQDVKYGRTEFRYQLDSKAMGVLPNPADFNLFMVQTGTPGEQLRLFDIRVQRSELHAFGWKQESSESQSALINQTWSPDGLYIASGSADPKIHIFDIRYNSKEPSQSIKAHQKRVFKAAWHHSLPLLISISSDLNIGLHRFSQ